MNPRRAMRKIDLGEKRACKKPKKEKKTVSDSVKFKRMARELLGQPSWSERFLGLLESDVPNIALHPFAEEDLPIPLSEARFYSDGLVQALIREADGKIWHCGTCRAGHPCQRHQ